MSTASPAPIRWGIIGTGNIARKFAEGLSVIPDAVLTAVGSRQQASAESFGAQFGIPKRYASYEAVANDPDVDAIYISTIHPLHYENMRACLEAGKATLCEKPFTLNAPQTAEMIALARAKGVFLMEAMWTRFIPAMVEARRLLAEGAIGQVRMVTADFSFVLDGYDLNHRAFNLELGGGALLDVGIYPISFASMVWGQQPQHISSQVHFSPTGSDEQTALAFRYPGGEVALLSCGVNLRGHQEAFLDGTQGQLRIHSPFWYPDTLTLNGKTWQVPRIGNGYNYEAQEVMACIRAGQTESRIMPLDETLALMQTLDRIRADWGLRYPGE
jgi:predicted dehydrogenase